MHCADFLAVTMTSLSTLKLRWRNILARGIEQDGRRVQCWGFNVYGRQPVHRVARWLGRVLKRIDAGAGGRGLRLGVAPFLSVFGRHSSVANVIEPCTTERVLHTISSPISHHALLCLSSENVCARSESSPILRRHTNGCAGCVASSCIF